MQAHRTVPISDVTSDDVGKTVCAKLGSVPTRLASTATVHLIIPFCCPLLSVAYLAPIVSRATCSRWCQRDGTVYVIFLVLFTPCPRGRLSTSYAVYTGHEYFVCLDLMGLHREAGRREPILVGDTNICACIN